jgi:hypothetical protein
VLDVFLASTHAFSCSLDNWQNALRRQYDRRNPEANPLGSPSTVQTATNSRHTSVFKDEGEELDPEDHENKENGVEEGQGESPGPSHCILDVLTAILEDAEAKDTTDTASKDEGATSPKATKMSERAASTTEERVTVDWSELTMDQKLESLHTVIEWQFQNPLRLRQLMKTDDEGATWVRGLSLQIRLLFDHPHSVLNLLDTTRRPTHTG